MEPKNRALQPQLTASSSEALTALGLTMGICGSGQSWVQGWNWTDLKDTQQALAENTCHVEDSCHTRSHWDLDSEYVDICVFWCLLGGIRNTEKEAGLGLRLCWEGACLACAKPWVPSAGPGGTCLYWEQWVSLRSARTAERTSKSKERAPLSWTLSALLCCVWLISLTLIA